MRDHYDDGASYGNQGVREYDHGGHKQLENIHDSHGHRDYNHGENHGLRDIAQQAHHNQGAHAAVHASGGQSGHVRKHHDKGFYEREKKYGYEKAYGYERETSHHDKSDNAQSHGSQYHHNENKGHYNQGGHAVRDLAKHGNKHSSGSESNGNRNILIDLSGDHNRGKDIHSSYDSRHKLRDLHSIPRHEPLRPIFLKQGYISDIDGSLARFRHLSGIHGLGGIRSYGVGYGYNPLRYGYNPMLNRQVNQQLMYLRQPYQQTVGPTNNLY